MCGSIPHLCSDKGILVKNVVNDLKHSYLFNVTLENINMEDCNAFVPHKCLCYAQNECICVHNKRRNDVPKPVEV